MPKYEVTFEGEAESEHELRRSLASAGFRDLSSITELRPKFEAGWYQEKDALLGEAGNEVVYFTVADLELVGDEFLNVFQRMNPPTPYKEEKYKDGYYEMSDGYLYRRLDGIWTFQYKNTSGWIPSEYNDDNIESKSGNTIKPVGE